VFGRRVLPHVTRAQRAVEVLAGAAVLVFVAWKLYERRWLVRHYSVARVEIAELHRLLASERPEVHKRRQLSPQRRALSTFAR
jgi:hypothetical protein